jgi:hypothetical protein
VIESPCQRHDFGLDGVHRAARSSRATPARALSARQGRRGLFESIGPSRLTVVHISRPIVSRRSHDFASAGEFNLHEIQLTLYSNQGVILKLIDVVACWLRCADRMLNASPLVGLPDQGIPMIWIWAGSILFVLRPV